MNIFLIGCRCTGKSTVGETLAERLGRPFMDTDRMVVEASGISIAKMVEKHGWPFFREREHEALLTSCARDNQVVATGGGIVLDVRNVSAMKDAGCAVWLTARRETILARMLGDETTAVSRPSLTGEGLLEEIDTVLAERKPLYAKAADLTIDTDQATIEEICERIVTKYEPSRLFTGLSTLNPINQ